MSTPNEKITRQVSPQWDWLMREVVAEKIVFGEARIIFHNGEPVEIVEMLRRKRFGG